MSYKAQKANKLLTSRHLKQVAGMLEKPGPAGFFISHIHSIEHFT